MAHNKIWVANLDFCLGWYQLTVFQYWLKYYQKYQLIRIGSVELYIPAPLAQNTHELHAGVHLQ